MSLFVRRRCRARPAKPEPAPAEAPASRRRRRRDRARRGPPPLPALDRAGRRRRRPGGRRRRRHRRVRRRKTGRRPDRRASRRRTAARGSRPAARPPDVPDAQHRRARPPRSISSTRRATRSTARSRAWPPAPPATWSPPSAAARTPGAACRPAGKAVTSAAVRVSGGGSAKRRTAARRVRPRSRRSRVQGVRRPGLATLQTQTARLSADLDGRRPRRGPHRLAHRAPHVLLARRRLRHLRRLRREDQRPQPTACPAASHDPDFTGFHRIEYGLWHGQSAATLRPVRRPARRRDVDRAAQGVPHAGLRPRPTCRCAAHEILENTLQFELTGDTDQGSGSNLATADANLAGTRELLTVLRPLITAARRSS